MARSIKMTFTLDQDTVERIDETAVRLGIPKSGVIREAVADFASREGRLSERERQHMLRVFDSVTARIPKRSAAVTNRELEDVRRARRAGGRRTPSARHR
jgi:hypothetical protein